MTNDSYLHINKHIPLSAPGGAGVSALTFANTPDRFSLPKFFTKTPMIKSILTASKSTISQPISQPPEDLGEDLLKATPVSDQQLAETVAKQVGYQPGDQVTGAVLPKKIPNTRLLYVSVPDWSEPVICSVQNAADWPAGERIKCVYVKADAEGRLVFENRDGIRRNRWRR